MKNSRNPDDLKPHVKGLWLRFETACLNAGIKVILTSTLRDYESQDDLYAQGRTKPGAIVTKAKGGYSYHNFGLAFDVVPVVNGKAVWNDEKLWQQIGTIGQSVGLQWGGARDFGFPDKPHFQYTSGQTLEQLRANHA